MMLLVPVFLWVTQTQIEVRAPKEKPHTTSEEVVCGGRLAGVPT
jgi:hypothetical protein